MFCQKYSIRVCVRKKLNNIFGKMLSIVISQTKKNLDSVQENQEETILICNYKHI